MLRAGAPSPASPFAQSPNYSFNANGGGGGPLSPGSAHSLSFVGASDLAVANSPAVATRDALRLVPRPRTTTEKARLNAGLVVVTDGRVCAACIRWRECGSEAAQWQLQ